MNTEHATPELFAALAKAQGEIQNATKNASNPHFRSSYADLAEVMTTIRESFPKHGLSILQSPHFDGSMAHVTTMIAHASGGWISDTASCVPAKTDAQGIGAATTYLRRYSASALAGISQEDDDGEAAAHSAKPQPVSEREAATVQEWVDTISGAPDTESLEAMGAEIAKAELSGGAKVKVRAAYAARKHAIDKAAA